MKTMLPLIFAFLLTGCLNTDKVEADATTTPKNELVLIDSSARVKTSILKTINVNKDVPIRGYFKWMDSVVADHNQRHSYDINEYILVHHNKWIIDTLAHTDYYYLMDKGIFNEDSQSLVALQKNQVLIIPDSLETQNLRIQLSHTFLELNIPEFRIRIIQDDKELYKFPVRVGKVGKKYMEMAKGNVDMRTKPGVGEIIRVNKKPTFANPTTNRKYHRTTRDDGKSTMLPAIPWLEPSINGRSLGQLIHPTTNLETLGKASSNGCIGLRESDAWIVYYYAPLGTKIVIKYELQGKNNQGELVSFKDIYPGFGNKK
ncbi:L,D-transpeptidase [Gelidibacter salicanalis]|uniref:L,D-transpeptidase n=1 Tax=Gelidibacter salicanalis TaxID=291193 RepID=A0A934KPB4_9FLAO|nr:L,D-transpeptidase [Gelidibacter salicanalis]MBJ7881374.1 L,D-transpeptidase [Gelidibacter salicanalis]